MYKYKTVYELNKNQLEELKHSLFYNFRYNEDERKELKEYLSKVEVEYLDNINLCFWEIPDNIIYKVYDGINFTDNDFYCSCGDNLENTHAF